MERQKKIQQLKDEIAKLEKDLEELEKPKEEEEEEEYLPENYIKKDGSTCFGCRTGGNPKCLCEEEEKISPIPNYDKGDGDWRCKVCDGYV